jgi:hypothetical protein
MMKPISDRAEIAMEYPEKLYIGTFSHTARFDAHLDRNGVALTLELPGPEEERKTVRMHFHYVLFADILRDLPKRLQQCRQKIFSISMRYAMQQRRFI